MIPNSLIDGRLMGSYCEYRLWCLIMYQYALSTGDEFRHFSVILNFEFI